MKKITCSKCGFESKAGTKFCPECGQELSEALDEVLDKKENKFRLNLSKGTVIKIIIAVVCITVIIISAGIGFSIYNSGYNRFNRAYNKGDIEAVSNSYLYMNKNEIEKSTLFLNNEAQNSYDKFINKQVDYEETISKFSTISESYHKEADLKIFKELKDNVEALNKSRKNFEAAEENNAQEKYEKAYDCYLAVIEKDENYDIAQSRAKELKIKIADNYYEKAQDLYILSQYNEALNAIESALKYDSKSEYTTLKDNCNEEIRRIAAEKAEAERQAKLLTNGKEINSSVLNVTYTGAEFTSRINPDKTNGAFLYYSCKSNDDIFLDITFTVTNVSDYNAKIKLVSSAKTKYGTKNFTSYAEYYCYRGTNDIDKVYSSTGIAPLKTATYHCAIVLPYEAINSGESITVEMNVNGQPQILEFR